MQVLSWKAWEHFGVSKGVSDPIELCSLEAVWGGGASVRGTPESVATAIGRSDKASNRQWNQKAREGRECLGSKIQSLATGWLGGWRAGRS